MGLNVAKAEKYLQEIYRTHYPEKYTRPDGSWYWGQCRGDHGVSGYEFEIDMDENGLCYEYKIVAGILELPIVMPGKCPPRKPVPESEKTVMEKAWEKIIVKSLESFRPSSPRSASGLPTAGRPETIACSVIFIAPAITPP